MNVKLVSVTESHIHVGPDNKKLSPEELLVYIARVSNPSNQENTETSEKLLNYLIRQKHWSPFDMINVTFEVKTSKAIGIQILRHFSIKVQEFSQRYAEVTEIEPIQLRKTGSSNRQSSVEVFDPVVTVDWAGGSTDGAYFPAEGTASEIIDDTILYLQGLYRGLIKAGVAKECARMILPMATSTTMYLNGSVRSWLFYLSQRTDHHAQLEHQEVAKEIERIFMEVFPNTHRAFFTKE